MYSVELRKLNLRVFLSSSSLKKLSIEFGAPKKLAHGWLQPLPKYEEVYIGRKSPHLSHLDLLLSLDGDIRWRNGGGENRLSPKRLKRGDGDRRRSRPDDDNGLRSYRS